MTPFGPAAHEVIAGQLMLKNHSAGCKFMLNSIVEAPVSEPKEQYMEAFLPVLALAIYFAIWAVVISGSSYFNKNVR